MFLLTLGQGLKSEHKLPNQRYPALIFQQILSYRLTPHIKFIQHWRSDKKSHIWIEPHILSKLLKYQMLKAIDGFGDLDLDMDFFSAVVEQRFYH